MQLVLLDQDTVPDEAEITGWLAGVDAPRVHTVRTGALFPAAAERFGAAGFDVADTLALLRIDLTTEPAMEPPAPPPDVSTGALRRTHHGAAAAIDQAAFGEGWGNDTAALTEIRTATPAHHATARFRRHGRVRRSLVGFAITGAASGQGYLQRLAVDPSEQRLGHGRALTLESLAWMRRRGLAAGLVNTAVTNDSALALYRSVGFQPLAEHLVVMQRSWP